MSIDTVKLNNDIKKVVGDLNSQYTVETAIELANSVRDLTRDNVFFWNTKRTTGLTHTNGLINLPTNCAKILFLYDSDGAITYTGTQPETFYPRLDGFKESGYYNRGTEIPIIRGLDTNTGSEFIQVVTGADTNASLTFNLVHTVYYTDIATWMPDRLYAYFFGYTVSKILNRVDNPDTQLLQYYDSMWKECLKVEKSFSAQSAYIHLNQKAISNNMAIRTNSTGI